MQQCLNSLKTMINSNVQKVFGSPCSKEEAAAAGASSDDTCVEELETLCICQAITPVIRYCQIFGILPAVFHSRGSFSRLKRSESQQLFKFSHTHQRMVNRGLLERMTSRRKQECLMSPHWLSLPSFTNIMWMLSFAGVTTWAFYKMRIILSVYFEGTDLYTFGAQTICLYTQSNIILINSFMQRERFCEIWELLLKVLKQLLAKPSFKSELIQDDAKSSFLVPPVDFVVASALLHQLEYKNKVSSNNGGNDKEPKTDPQIHREDNKEMKLESSMQKRLKRLRIFSYVCIVIILSLSTAHIISFFKLVFHACFDKAADPGSNGVFGKPPCPLNNVLLLLQKCFYGMIDFVKQGVAILFGTFCLIIYIFFKELEEQLDKCLRGFGEIIQPAVSMQWHYQIEHLRLCYEDLSRLCRLVSECFGLAIIFVMITSIISITCALYSFALYSGAIQEEETLKVARFYVIWAFHGWFGCFCLFLVLIPGQMITNASSGPSQVIAKHSLVHLDKETKYQISQFQYQAREPIVLTAFNVANVGLGFISSAATNVTTYMLVILQFRLGVERT